MLHKMMTLLDKMVGFHEAKAHCDIPCGIYDPIFSQVAALTTVRMIDMAADLERKAGKDALAYENTITRLILVKEEHAEKCKHEVRVLMGDYFTPEHKERYRELEGLGAQILKQASQTRQTFDREKAMELVQSVNRLAEIFWETKGIRTRRAKAPYEPKEELVYAVLA